MTQSVRIRRISDLRKKYARLSSTTDRFGEKQIGNQLLLENSIERMRNHVANYLETVVRTSIGFGNERGKGEPNKDGWTYPRAYGPSSRRKNVVVLRTVKAIMEMHDLHLPTAYSRWRSLYPVLRGATHTAMERGFDLTKRN